ncbi:MAG: hypothetical protein ACKVQR_03875 [Aquabacterium sp.]
MRTEAADDTPAIAALAARLVIDEGMEYGPAKHKAARTLERRGARRPALPSNEAIEDEVRSQLKLFHGDDQPADLAALRDLALRWMERLAAFRPHLSGAAWRGTATRLSALHLDLYCDDTKAAQIEMINLGVDFDCSNLPGDTTIVLSFAQRCADWREAVTIHLSLHDHDDLRGALKPDPRGQTWRGDAQTLQRRLAEGAGT